MIQYLFVRVDPADSCPLEMSLESRSLPGIPKTYVIACRRAEDMEITDRSNQPYRGRDYRRMGVWEQPVSEEFARRVVGLLEEATIPWSIVPDRVDGPAVQRFAVRLGRTRVEWDAHELGNNALSEAVRMMIDAVERPVPVLVPVRDLCSEMRVSQLE